jgi:hypothetical protein
MTAGFETKLQLPYVGIISDLGDPVNDRIIRFPFIFGGKNYALKSNGAAVAWKDYSQYTRVDPTSDIENMIDGSRSTTFFMDRLSDRYWDGSSTSNYGIVNLDMSDSMSGDDEVNVICIDADTVYPIGALQVFSYTDSAFSANKEDHYVNQEYWIFAPGNGYFYQYGFQPKIDVMPLGTSDDSTYLQGADGQYLFFGLQTPITSDRPYVQLQFRYPSRGRTGYNGDFKLGLWGTKVDETLQSSDPNDYHSVADSPVYGNDDDYMYLVGNGGAAQRTGFITCGMRSDHTYALCFYHKTTIAGGNNFNVYITYYDWEQDAISTHNLLKDQGIFAGASSYFGTIPLTDWTDCYVLINWLRDGRRRSGKTTVGTAEVVHDVPPRAKFFKVWFEFNADATAPTWKIDDVSLYSIQTKGFLPEVHAAFAHGNENINHALYKHFDFSGKIGIRRVGMYKYDFATTAQRGALAKFQDLGGFGGANFAGVRAVSKGKSLQRNIHGRIVGQFVPISGVKESREYSMIATKELKNAVTDLYSSEDAFSVIEPQGDFADYMIAEGSLTWKTIASQELSNPANYLWEGTMVLEEI